MARLSKAALERKEKAKAKIDSEIADFTKKIHDLRKSDESRLAKTEKMKYYQQQISKLKYDLSNPLFEFYYFLLFLHT